MSESVKKCRIYTFYHQPKKYILQVKNYIPVWVGKNNKSMVPGYIGDDTGDNISAKNKYFSELTGIYWVWKNTRSEIVGSCHYRRYFTNATEPFLYRLLKALYFPVNLARKGYGLIYTGNFNYWASKILKGKEIKQLLDKYNILLPKRRKLRINIKSHYEKYVNSADLILLREILAEYFPEYLNSYESLLSDKRLFANNMFIMRWDSFDILMNWLFFILFKFEEKINLEHYKGYQERIFGFLSERLITLCVVRNNLKYKELPLVYFKKLKQE